MASESSSQQKTKIVARWYFGGLGSAGAACCTHPLDLLKVCFSFIVTLASVKNTVAIKYYAYMNDAFVVCCVLCT